MSILPHIKDFFTPLPVAKGKKVLMWHNVVDDNTPVFNLRTHRQSDFHRQISALKKRHTLVGPEEWSAAKESDAVILVTFDDGLHNNFLFAAPVLEDIRCPAVFFISTFGIDSSDALWPDEVEWICFRLNQPVELDGLIYRRHRTLPVYVNDKNERLVHKLKWLGDEKIADFIRILREKCPDPIPKAYRLMSATEIAALSKNSLFTIGSHSHRHLPLATMDIDMQRTEIATSLNSLKEICQRDISCIAFPDGSFNDETLQVCQELQIPYMYGVASSGNNLATPRTGLYTDGRWKQQLTMALR